jgi:hypothetical protein
LLNRRIPVRRMGRAQDLLARPASVLCAKELLRTTVERVLVSPRAVASSQHLGNRNANQLGPTITPHQPSTRPGESMSYRIKIADVAAAAGKLSQHNADVLVGISKTR